MRIFVFLLAALTLAAALLTQVRAPTLAGWKLAIAVGEFGHWLGVVPVLVAAAAWRVRRGDGVDFAALVACAAAVLAFALMATPVVQAWTLGRALPARLAAAFPGPPPAGPAFSWSRLWMPEPVVLARVTTHRYAERPGGPMELDLYHPAAGGRAPCVVVVHGGGWNGGDRKQLSALNHHLAARGYAVAAVSYRLAPAATWPAPRDDVLAALEWLRTRAGELGIDPARLVLLGRSAGGQIALAAAYGPPAAPGVRGVISLYGPADLNFAYAHGREDDVLRSRALLRAYLGGSPEDLPEAYEAASPIRQVRADVPPTLLVHGKLDTLVWHRQSERLARRLAEVRARHHFLSLPWATHAFDYNLRGPGGQLAVAAVEDFLARVTGP
jgi:acetyl esterase/lipase